MWLLGIALLAAAGVERIDALDGERAARREAARRVAASAARTSVAATVAASSSTSRAAPVHARATPRHLERPAAPDVEDWSAERIERYEQAGDEQRRAAHGILRIPSIDLEVAVLPAATKAMLDIGAGLIDGTSLPVAGGNTGIAAHRDGFFRALRHIELGDRIHLDTVNGRFEYVVSETSIVAPSSVEVLAERSRPVLTLVTCYPFYFVGPAPQRFVVHAEQTAVELFGTEVARALHGLASP
ncbi:MAG: class D sortase [Gammaproteobacteria bacterium]